MSTQDDAQLTWFVDQEVQIQMWELHAKYKDLPTVYCKLWGQICGNKLSSDVFIKELRYIHRIEESV